MSYWHTIPRPVHQDPSELRLLCTAQGVSPQLRTKVAPKSGPVFEPRIWAQNRARFSARLCRDWRRDFAAIGGATSPQAEARRGENAGSQSCRSLRATARPSALHSAVLTLRLTPELEVSRAGRRSSWSAAWQCGCTAYASAAGDERTPAWGMSASDSRFRAEAEYKFYGDATDNTMHL